MENITTEFYTEPGKEGTEQVSRHEFRIAPGSGSSACSEPPHLSTINPDPVDGNLGEDFVHVNARTDFLDTQGNPQHDLSVAPDTEQNGFARSDSPHSTSKFAPVVEQGKEDLTGLYTENTTPHGSCGPQLENRDQHLSGTSPDTEFPDKNINATTQYDSPTVQGNEQNLARFDPSRSATKPTPVGNPREQTNIVIFGETGVGKSSIINLIADRELADTSNDTLGCTFQHKRHSVMLGDMSCSLWDTAGLDEGTEGTVPAEIAENNLRGLMRELGQSGGIHLIIYCIRASRLTKALKRNYDLFYVTVCRKKVPVALVVTGLEHQIGEMETWWATNEAALQRFGMRFDAHACVTTLNVGDPTIRQRRSHSQKLLCELVVKYSELPPWKVDASLISWVLPMFRMASPRNTAAIRKVIVYGSFIDSGKTVVLHNDTEQIGDRQYAFIQVNKHTTPHTPSPRMTEDTGNLSAGMLVFYSSPLVNHCMSSADVGALKRFYAEGGQLCPVIVVQQGCHDENVTAYWSEFTSRHGIQAHFTSLPSTPDDAREALNVLIEDLYVEPAEVKGPGRIKKIMDAGNRPTYGMF
ncbi:hypothetical protein JVT61DRAFT_15400 [Boletus reticuloceps]|uniref:G domain-containing protein n=1 Tax=Boletus reticuloceps TaxID=495285 RepID=A0A8I2YUE1_9AGAM|nr:hypothetical protein JVT61DRAFT_15400 [Boletus reticuloceps]